MIKIVLLVCMAFLSHQAAAQMTDAWGNQGDGTYQNPVLPADYSDLDAIRVGKDYYAISSTFQYSPGMVILHSTNLVNWQIIGHVATDVTQIGPALNWDKMDRYGKGIWAGAIRYHDNKFWVYFCTPDEGFFMSSATNPAGPWEPLHPMWKVTGWDDCCPFWDDDGQGYLITTNYTNQYNIHLFKMTADGKQLVPGSDSILYRSKGSEASKLYKINGRYYHYFSEVKAEGRVPMMRRANNLYGPYQTKQLMHVNKKTDREPNQGALLQDTAGAWWFFTHHGTGGHWEGRTASLLPVQWMDGWPIPGHPGTDTIGNMVWKHSLPQAPANLFYPATTDSFNKNKLSVQWEWNHQPRDEKWSLTQRRGFLRLHAFVPVPLKNSGDKRALLYRSGNTLTQRSMRTKQNEVTIKMDVSHMQDGQVAGLCHYAATYSSIGLRQMGKQTQLCFDNNGQETMGPAIRQAVVWLRSSWNAAGASQYSYSLDGKTFIPFGSNYQLSWGHYRGDRIGIFNYHPTAAKGWVDVDWFNYTYTRF